MACVSLFGKCEVKGGVNQKGSLDIEVDILLPGAEQMVFDDAAS